MKILLITAEEWNDLVFGNGVLMNWFSKFNAEFAQIYTSPGIPYNDTCNLYFRISDGDMVRSFFGKKAGYVIQKSNSKNFASMDNPKRKGVYGVMKKVSLWLNTPVILLRDFIWCYGRYDKDALKKFIDDFNPDIVFCPRYLTPALMRLEKLVSTMTNAPFVAFTADDEASYREYSLSPLFWLRRIWIHHKFTNHLKTIGYKHYWTFSEDQAMEYAEEYGIKTSTLYKCGDFPDMFVKKEVGKPIRMVYAGRLYCNRWKTLSEIGKALKEINCNGERMVLDIYTTEKLTSEHKKALCQENSIYVHGRVTPAELIDIYKKSDVALHVESFDRKYKLATRVSFSTKIIDLMASSCAILAVCWDQHAGYKYLKEHDAAFCISNYKELLPLLNHICNNPTMIQQYAQKAYNCGIENHSRKKIQDQIRKIFELSIKDNNTICKLYESKYNSALL